MDRTIFNEDHEMFRDASRAFLINEIKPYRDKWAEQEIVDREAFLKAGEQGMLCMWADEKYGGAGITDFRFEQILLHFKHFTAITLPGIKPADLDVEQSLNKKLHDPIIFNALAQTPHPVNR